MKYLFLLLLCSLAHAGLPPTATKGSNDASFVTTFNFGFPNVSFAHTGTTANFGTVGYGSGGTNATTNWTAGSVFFAATTAFGQDNANFFWDLTNHRLGIGTAVPLEALHIAETGAGDILLTEQNTGSAGHGRYDTGVDTSGFWHFAQNGAGFYALTVDNSGDKLAVGNYGALNSSTFGINASAEDNTPLTIRGFSGGTSDLLDVQTGTPTTVARIDSAGNITATNLSGTNTGNVTLTAVGAVPNANGASLSGQALTLQPANTSFPGVLTAADWNTFNGKQGSGNYITALTGDVTASGPGSVAATLATVNANTGGFGSSTSIPNFTVNGKGLITAAGGNVVIAPAGTLTGTTLASNVVTSSLTTVGTIGTGTWAGTTVATNHGGTGAIAYSDGQLLIGDTSSGGLDKATLTQGTGITITNGNGSITIAASGSGTTTYAYSGYFDNNCAYATSSTTPVTPADRGSGCALHQVTNTNFGTVTAQGSVKPGIVFTPDSAGDYNACFTITATSNGNANGCYFEVYDFTNSITYTSTAWQTGTAGANEYQATQLCSVVPVANTSPLTLGLRFAAVSASTCTIAALSAQAVYVNIFKIH